MVDTATAGTRTHSRLASAVLAAAVVATFGFCYYDVIGLLVYQWWTKDFYSYGFLIPAISAYLAWSRRDRIRARLGAPSFTLGVVLLGFALFALQLGRAASFALLEEASLPLALAAIILLVGGRRALRAAWLPVAYLFFAIPVWDVLTDNLHHPFQIMTATMGQRFMGLAGVPSLRVGTILYLPSITLEVATACSGVSYLISVIAIAVPYAYLNLSSNLRRAAAGVFAVMVAILSNGVRVGLIGILQYYRLSGPQDLHGPAHTLQGMFVAVVGYAALFTGVRFLEDKPGTGRPAAMPAAKSWRPSSRALATCLLLLLGAGLLRPYAETVPAGVAGGDSFPLFSGTWMVQTRSAVGEPISWPGADQSISKVYLAPGIGTIRLYVGYQANQAPGRKLVGDGQLRLPERTRTVRLKTPDGTDVVAAEGDTLDDPVPERRAVTLSWYDLHGRRGINPYWVKLVGVWNSLVYRRSSGAVVVFVLTPAAGASQDTARAALLDFAGRMAPYTAAFLSPEAGAR